MPTPDDRLILRLLERLVSQSTPGVTALDDAPFASMVSGGSASGIPMGDVVRSDLVRALRSASPKDRKLGRARFASLGGPAGLKAQRDSVAVSLRHFTGPQRKGIQSLDPLVQLQRDISRDVKRRRTLGVVAQLEQEAARRSDLVRRIMRVLKTQPGLPGIGLLVLLPALAALASQRSRSEDTSGDEVVGEGLF